MVREWRVLSRTGGIVDRKRSSWRDLPLWAWPIAVLVVWSLGVQVVAPDWWEGILRVWTGYVALALLVVIGPGMIGLLICLAVLLARDEEGGGFTVDNVVFWLMGMAFAVFMTGVLLFGHR